MNEARILIIKWGALGDLCAGTALMEDIRLAFPDAALDLNVLPEWATLFEHDPRFRQLVCLPLRTKGQKLRASWQWLRQVVTADYDLIIDLQCNDRSRLLLCLLWLTGRGPKKRLGIIKKFPYNHGGKAGGPAHPLHRYQLALNCSGIATTTQKPVLHGSDRNRERVKGLLDEQGLLVQDGEIKPFAIFLPGSAPGGELKRWGARRYIALAHQLARNGMARTLLVGTAGENPLCSEIQAALPDFIGNLCGHTQLLDLLPLATAASVIIGSDTGTAHLMAASGTRLIVICGPTDPHRVAPQGGQVKVLQADIHCRNCYRKQCSHHSCMLLLSPERVFEELNIDQAAQI